MSPMDEDVQALVEAIEAQYPVSLFMYPMSGTQGVRIATLRVPADQRGMGIGSQVMAQVVEWADRRSVTLVLTPESEGRGAPSKTKLKQWYRSFGFVPNKGRNKDYYFTDAMIRPPR